MASGRPARLDSSPVNRLATALLSVCAFVLLWHDMQTYDVWWHLGSGRWILAHGVPHFDPFSFGFPGRQWIEHHWLYDALVWLLYDAGGANALIVMKVVVFAGALALLALAGRRAPREVLLLGLLLALVAGHERFVVRAEMFTVAALLWTLYVSDEARAGRVSRAALYSLPLVQLAWVQLHGLWILGPVVQATVLLADSLPLPAALWRSREARGPRTTVLVLCALAALVNPYGLRGALFPFHLFAELGTDHPIGELIGEFASPFSALHFAADYRTLGYLGVVAVSALGFVAARRRVDAGLLALWLAFAALSGMALRNVALFGYVAAFCLLRNAGAEPRGFVRWRLPALLAAMSFSAAMIPWVAGNGFYLHQGWDARFGLGISPRKYPVGALAFARERGLPLPLIHGIGDGGYVLFDGGENSAYIDGRLEVYGPDNLTTAIRLSSRGDGLESEAARTGARTVLVRNEPRDLGLLQVLEASPGWLPVYCDPRHVLYVRREAAGRGDVLDWERSPCTSAGHPPPFAPPRGLPGWWPAVAENFADDRLGTLYLAVGRYGPALQAFERALAQRPADPRARLHVGLFYRALGREREAQSLLAGVPAAMRDAPDTLTFAGEAALWAGRPAAALTPLRRVAEISGDPAAQRRLARALIGAGRPDEARALLERLVERFSADTAALNTLGALALKNGETTAARDYLQRSLDVEADQPRVRELLGGIAETSQDQ